MKESIFSKAAGCKRVKACSITKLNSFISTFKGFTKSVSYLALHFSKLGKTFFKKYLLPSGHDIITMSKDLYTTTAVTTLCVR